MRTELTSKILWAKIFSLVNSLLIIVSPLIINWANISNIFSDPVSVIGEARASAISIFLGLIFYIIYLSINKFKKLQKIALISFFTITMLIILTFSIKGTFLNNYFENLDIGNRLSFWDVATEAISEKPMLGWGINSFEQIISQNLDIYLERNSFFAKKELNSNKVHNVFLDHFVSGGVFVFLLYLLILITSFFYLTKKQETIPLAILIVSLSLSNSFSFDTIISYPFMALLGAFAGHSFVSDTGDYSAYKKDIKKMVVVFILAGVTLWFLFIIPFKQQTMLRNSFKEIRTDYTKIISMYPWKTSSQAFLMSKFWDDKEIVAKNQEVLLPKMQELRSAMNPYLKENLNDYRYLSAYYYMNFVELLITNDFDLLIDLSKYNDDLQNASPGNPELKNLIGTVETNLKKYEAVMQK